ncbi:acVLRF1 family peptidyl-tRNA hydrolase [Microlunatus sp. Gsoil 973]|uniref:acVLRF1 family peptidyl-tRNA hydrolase n=1 Tax=Microlunatus sp. Gsoil 973 TaxID=2672569 RepID=UPI0012B48910|nr:acVLRF1 family peptidyl-tRNA hydrolase [Microlunatus sp. Gsoil 973]QGN33632.1 hypothetical protein GJV80_13365 [Microlunatus sp. Gsoil 973]
MSEPATRRIAIARERLPRWITGFAERHGAPEPEVTIDGSVCILHAPDRATARIAVPFGPLVTGGRDDRSVIEGLVDHVLTDRRVGALLVRRGGFAVGVFDGTRLVDSKVGSSYVQSRTKAGGWSQQRYARRRGNQARQLYDRAADAAASVLLPVADDLEAVARGGDRAGVDAVLDDPRFREITKLVLPRIYPTEDPRLRVLEAFPEAYLAITIELNELA